MKKATRVIWAGLLALGLSGAAQATLMNRGNGMIYDSDQDLTWLQDANYVVTSGYAAANAVNNGSLATNNIFTNGRMGWDAAMAWATGLSYGGYNDWRLPTITDKGNDNDGCNFGYSGTDCGYNVDTSGSELAYMWYEILGNIAFYDTSGNGPQAGWGLTSTAADGVDILNLQSFVYWSGTEYAPDSNAAWFFNTLGGNQSPTGKGAEFYAWAVRSGDVAGVPEPATLLLLGLGLAALGAVRRGQSQR